MSISTITARDFVQYHANDDDVCVIDVRTIPEIKSSHFKNSINIPLQGLTAERVTERLARCDKSPSILFLLCQGGKRAQTAAEQLDGKISQELVVIEGGVNALKQANAPLIQNASSSVSIERQVRIVAGSIVLFGAIMAAVYSPSFIIISGIVGAGLIFAGITNNCTLGNFLTRMPWNK